MFYGYILKIDISFPRDLDFLNSNKGKGSLKCNSYTETHLRRKFELV